MNQKKKYVEELVDTDESDEESDEDDDSDNTDSDGEHVVEVEEATPQAAGTLLRIGRAVENVEVDDVVTPKDKKDKCKIYKSLSD